jgi:hypothetical protein
MNTFIETDYSHYNDHNMMAQSHNEAREQQMALMVDNSENPGTSSAGKGDSAVTAFLRSKKQNALSGTQHTNSTFDTFAQEDQEWEDNDDVPEDESILSFDINDIENELGPLSSYNVPDNESIVPLDINDTKTDLIPLSGYNADAVDEALKWTEAFMDYDSDEESIEEAPPLHDSMSSFNEVFVKLTGCMERSAHTRQELVKQLSEKSLVSTTSSTASFSQHSLNHNDSLQLLDPRGLARSSHSSTSTGLVRPRIKKVQNVAKSGLTRRLSHRSLSGPDITRRGGLVKKDSLSSLNGSLKSISLHRNSSWGNLPRSSSFRMPKLSQETTRSLLGLESSASLSLRVKARLSQNVTKRRLLDQKFVFAAPQLTPKPTENDMVQHLSKSLSSIAN